MSVQSGGGRELQELTSFRILHALRFPIVGASIVLLAVISVIFSLTGPTEPAFLEEALSQSEPNTIRSVEIAEGIPNETVAEQTKATTGTDFNAQETQDRYKETLRSENINLEPYTPNFVPKGDAITTISSFSPPLSASENIGSSPPSPDPPTQNPTPDPTPDTNFIADVEQWRQSVESAINSYGGPSSDTNRFLRIMQCESMGQPNATNPSSGAAGLMQHLPQYWDARANTAGYPGYSAYDPIANINVSAWLIYQASGGGWQHWVCR
ncbi:MAG TPA: transglycosylase SLT domain-containing protein [Acidimicrobiales bacterium]|nr:transglycosylase SLT domain-containing protein [Acidimicrobiales bacterium]HJM97934.1 transglycosylase SLT domain-containing protein [Acidimicrobiales bacterium]